ncbi:MAG TPA: nitroreductase/quinone reductase family protein [Candidatus Limnocylindria bacterium]|nr:nitroreductase/quinone reductase family protein [Candidatus Limnocylindria bacterium]
MTEDDLALLREAEEVRIETSRHTGAPSRRTIIWVVVDDRDRVLVRSVRAERGRWYRDLLANPAGVLHLDGRALGVRAEQVTDGERIEACSTALSRKYADDPALPSMLRADTLPTTLQLHDA